MRLDQRRPGVAAGGVPLGPRASGLNCALLQERDLEDLKQ